MTAALEEVPAESIEAQAEEEQEKPIPPMQLPLPGTRETISDRFGGAKPTRSEMRLMGGKQPITGSFDKGDEVMLLIRAKVFRAGGVDRLDVWGQTEETVREHQARIISCEVFEDDA